MKNKLLSVLAVVFVVAVIALALTACGTNEQSIDGMYIVTFKFNGGVLDTGSTNARGEIFHAYDPAKQQPVIDISKKYSFTREGYIFDGWFVDEQLTEEWNFSTIITENVTLYARWKSAIIYTYTIYLQGEEKPLGSYEVEAGAKFNDVNRYGTSLNLYNKTFLGYCSDSDCTTEWNDNFVHPGGETSCDIPVYVKAMEGVWKFVSNYDELLSAIGSNIWLTASVDCGGEALYFGDSRRSFGAKLNGNNFTISNFKIVEKGTLDYPEYSLFGNLTADAEIYDVKFENAQFDINPKVAQVVKAIKASALALSAEEGATINNVSVSGTYANATDKELDRINQAFYEDSTVVLTEITINIAEQNG